MICVCYEILKEKKKYFSCYITVLKFFESLSGTRDLPPVFGDDDTDALPEVPEDPL